MALHFSDTTGLWLVYTTWLVLEPENGGGGAYLYTGMECVLRALPTAKSVMGGGLTSPKPSLFLTAL